MPVNLIGNQYGGMDEFAKAIPAAIDGYYASQDRKTRQMELAAKLAADSERKEREFAEYSLSAQGKGYKSPTSYTSPLERDEGFGLITDPSQRGQFEAKVAELPITDDAKKGLLQKYLYGNGLVRDRGIMPLEKTPAQRQIEDADLRKKLADARKAEREAYSPTKEMDLDEKTTVSTLATKNANKIAIKNQIDAVMGNWDDLTDDQKLAMGRQLLKTLNSPEGADAIGSEEANRLGSKLEFALGNFSNSNPTQIGRDLKGFKEQALNTSKSLGNAINLNKKTIDSSLGRTPKEGATTNDSGSKKPWENY